VHQSEKEKSIPAKKKKKAELNLRKKNLIVDIMKGSYEPCSQKSN